MSFLARRGWTVFRIEMTRSHTGSQGRLRGIGSSTLRGEGSFLQKRGDRGTENFRFDRRLILRPVTKDSLIDVVIVDFNKICFWKVQGKFFVLSNSDSHPGPLNIKFSVSSKRVLIDPNLGGQTPVFYFILHEPTQKNLFPHGHQRTVGYVDTSPTRFKSIISSLGNGESRRRTCKMDVHVKWSFHNQPVLFLSVRLWGARPLESNKSKSPFGPRGREWVQTSHPSSL